jgi:anti-sigma B factor antagonist
LKSFALRPLTTLSDIAPTRTTVYVRGEIDMATASQFQQVLEHHLTCGPSELLIDLSGVSFMDSSGVHALLVAVRAADQAGSSVALAGTSPQVARVLDLTGLQLPRPRHLTLVRAKG